MSKNPPQYLVLAAVLLTSSSSIFIRLSIMPPLVIALYRMAMSTAFLAVPMFWRRRELKAICRKDLLLCLVSGAALALHFAAWIASLSMTSVMASTVLVSTSPIFVAVFGAVFLRKRPGRVLLACLFAAFCGTIIITAGPAASGGNFGGNMLALAGAASVAVYLIIGQEVRKRMSAAAYSFVVYGASAVFLLGLNGAAMQPLLGYSLGDIGIILAMALVCSVFGHTLYNLLLKFHGAFLVSLATLCEPLFASILAAVILLEIPTGQTFIGGFIILASLAAYIYLTRENKEVIQ